MLSQSQLSHIRLDSLGSSTASPLEARISASTVSPRFSLHTDIVCAPPTPTLLCTILPPILYPVLFYTTFALIIQSATFSRVSIIAEFSTTPFCAFSLGLGQEFFQSLNISNLSFDFHFKFLVFTTRFYIILFFDSFQAHFYQFYSCWQMLLLFY